MKKYNSCMDTYEIKKVKTNIPRAQITSSKDAFEYMRQFYSSDIDIYESFFMMLLNRANNTTGFVKISQGGLTGTVTDVKLIAKYAIENLCTGIIVCHNHPSGNTNPSEADKKMTYKIQSALNLIDVKLLDHLIFTNLSYFSFSDEDLL